MQTRPTSFSVLGALTWDETLVIWPPSFAMSLFKVSIVVLLAWGDNTFNPLHFYETFNPPHFLSSKTWPTSPRILSSKNTKIQKYKNTKIQKYKNTKIKTPSHCSRWPAPSWPRCLSACPSQPPASLTLWRWANSKYKNKDKNNNKHEYKDKIQLQNMLCRLAGMADRLCTSPSTARATVARAWGGRWFLVFLSFVREGARWQIHHFSSHRRLLPSFANRQLLTMQHRCAGGAETLSASPLLPSARLPLPLYP